MHDVLMVVIVVLCLVLFGVLFYLMFAIPMKYYQKKEISAFTKLGNRFKLKVEPGKAGLKPNFPAVYGKYRDCFVVVQKAKTRKGTKGIWFLKLSAKLINPHFEQMFIINKKFIRERITIDKFYDYFTVEINQKPDNDFFDMDIKHDLIELWETSGSVDVTLKNKELYTSNFKGLKNDKDVELCTKKIDLLTKMAIKIDLWHPSKER